MTDHRTRLAVLAVAAAALAGCSSGPASPPALSSSRAALVMLPPDASFQPFLCSGETEGDVPGDPVTGGDFRDIVGDTTHPAFYRAADADHVFFRMRVSGDPQKPGGGVLQPSSWDVLVDTDGDLAHYEYMLTADGNLGGTRVHWMQNTIKELDPRDPAELLVDDLSPASDYWYVKQALDGSAFGGNPDYFITLVIPKATLQAAGLDLTRSFVVWGGTNAQTYSLNSDFGCYMGIPPSLGDAGNDPGDLDPPDAHDDPVTTPEDTPVTTAVLANDTGIEADTVLGIVSAPAHGTATALADRTVTYTPDPDWFGTDAYTYRVTDTTGETDTAVVTVTVTPVDDGPPVVVDDDWTMTQDTSSSLDVLANDTVTDGVAALTLVTPPAHGTVSVNPDQTILYTPAAAYVGPDAFVYQVTDTDGQTGSGTVAITVQPADSGFPVAVPDAFETAEDAALPALPVLANDTVLDAPAVVTLATAPAHGAAEVNADGTIAYTPAPDHVGQDFFTYEVADRDGQTATASVTITVTAVDDGPPVAVADEGSTPESTPVAVAVLGNDTVTDGLGAVVIVTQPAHGAAVVNDDHTITYTPDASYFGADAFTYQVSDLDGQSASAPVSLTVMPVDSGAPVAAPDAFSTAEDTALPSLDVLANDVVLDVPPVVSIATPPAHGTAAVNPDGTTIAYAPAPDYAGPDAFTYEVADRDGQAARATVSITVTPVGDPPVATPDAAAANAGWPPVVIPVLANDVDPDGDALTVVSATQGAHGTVTVLPDGTVRYLAAGDFVGVDAFTYVITDGTGTASATVTVTVAPPIDSDGDGIPDYLEDDDHDGTVDPGETDPQDPDTDDDGLPDGVEDGDHDGTVDPGETDPQDPDSDDDGLPDGVEDRDHDGTVDPGETDPLNPDTDDDGLPDGVEDRDHDGTVDPGETDPLNPDTDGDGLPDGVEDRDHDGTVDPGETDPLNPDTDGDGLPDGVEDRDHDGTVDPGETDPLNPDTDGDGLPDGVEDADHDGTVDPGETDPLNPDTDGDGLPDGVEDADHDGTVDRGETDPRNPDTNGDGILDGIGARGGGCGSGPGGGASLLLAAMAALLRRRRTSLASR